MRNAEEKGALVEDLVSIVGRAHVLTGTDVSARWDGYPPVHSMEAACIVRPANTAELSSVMAYCHRNKLRVVPQGGCTGLVGGARTAAGDIALSLERMRSIGPIDRHGATVEVDAGAPLQTIQEAAKAVGLIYPVDFGARGSATIGGTIATNAGGNSVFRYGMTREQLLGLEVVLADGTVLSSMNRLIKNNAAYDLKHLFVGSEGTLGIITRAVLRLRPEPGPKATAFIGLANFEAVLELLRRTQLSDGALTSYEVMWPAFIDLATRHGSHKPPLAENCAFYVLMEIASQRSDLLLEQVMSEAWKDGLIEDAAIAQTESQRNAFWAIRDDIDALAGAIRPGIGYDVSLPQAHMLSYAGTVREALRARYPDAALIVYGHIADGNLHLMIGPIPEADHDVVDEIVYSPLPAIGGSISAEHGIGSKKLAHLPKSRTGEELALMARLKGLLDPLHILNPGKVVPQIFGEHDD